VTYVARGFESMRGFDIFLKVAKRIYQQRSDVLFLVAGEDRVCYGGDAKVTGKQTFKEWALAQDDYDLSKFRFLGLVPPSVLAQLFSRSDLHVYLTVPFCLSWSLFDALACGTTVLASDTAPVSEVIQHRHNGLLADFFDVDGLAAEALSVLEDPKEYRALGEAGVEMIHKRYSVDVCLTKMMKLYGSVLANDEGHRSSNEVCLKTHRLLHPPAVR
jgi:glycosyltransferase involved in cell wall biosynthesis